MKSRVAWDRDEKTPFDAHPWPTKLTGRVVAPGDRPRIHGYDVDHDLAKHYRFTDTIFLSLTGELPTDVQSQLFESALHRIAPIGVGEAPSHAAVLTQICDAKSSAVIATGAIALSEQARAVVDEHETFLATLDGVAVPSLEQCPSRTAWLLSQLHWCGLKRRDQLESAWVVARIAVVAAEAFATPANSFKAYPLNLPLIRYEEP